ncbi:flagellin [Phenylobacterium aquaticum]|uniref:flagellin n=1 Tax=Phenylobacterium aquaticum TaxID=1763816 RepID=UPI0026F0DCE4|nr:flagellin [Phenylobacterium aquaticum]
MVSLLTNVSAMYARQALASANADSAQLRNRVATGLKVAGPVDDGATYAIAQNMRSELGGWRTLNDSLRRNQSTLDITTTAVEGVSDTLTEMRAKAVALADPSLDASSRAAYLSDIKDMVARINSAARNSSFSGINLLVAKNNTPVDITPAQGAPQANLNVSVPMTGEAGTLNLDVTVPYSSTTPTMTVTGVGDPVSVAWPQAKTSGSAIRLSLPIAYGDWNNPDVPGAGSVSFDFHSTPRASSNPQGFKINSLTFTALRGSESLLASTAGDTISLGYRPMTSDWLGLDNLDQLSLDGVVTAVDGALAQANSAAAYFGSQSAMIGRRIVMAGKLADTLEAGIGNIVDTDMAKDSAKLQASQVRESLATQSLAIAGQQAGWMLDLFRSAA